MGTGSRYSGQSVSRVDALGKAAGATRYVRDLVAPDAWFGAAIRSPVAAGHVRGLRVDPEFDLTSVVLVEPHEIPGENTIAFIQRDMPCLASATVQYMGEPVALVAAPDRHTLAAALEAITADIEPATPFVGIDAVAQAMRHEPASLHDLYALTIAKGDVAAGLAAADVVVEGEYITAPQEHAYLEPQAMAATPRPDGTLHVFGSLQCPYYVQPSVALALGVAPESIIVEQCATGGAFGGKEDFPSVIGTYAALLARKANRTVVIDFDRQVDMAMTTKRHGSYTRIRMGVTRDGQITALDADFVIDGGAYVTLSPVVLSRGSIHLAGPYRTPHVQVRGRAVKTNTMPAGAFRGFGAPQAIFAIEAHLDKVAAAIGMDPLELRRRNVLRLGDRTATGQTLGSSVAIEQCFDTVVSRSDYVARRERARANRQRHPDSDRLGGVGFALFWHGGGFTGSGEKKLASRCAMTLDPDGAVTILAANTEFGQGTQTSLAQIAADALQVPLDRVRYPLPNTAHVPNSGPTVASRTTMVVGKLVELCAYALTREVERRLGATRVEAGFRLANGQVITWYDAASRACTHGPVRVEEQYALPPGLHWDDEAHSGDAYPAYSWGAIAAEVEVDRATSEVTCTHVWCTVDIGTVINPREARGQVEGALAQALGWALLEHVSYTPEGRVREDRFQTYIIPTTADMPRMDVTFVEAPWDGGPFGAKGLGELPMNGLAPALHNAIRDAIGAAVARLPMSPERVDAARLAPVLSDRS